MELTVEKAFEMMGRLYVENRGLLAEVERLRALLAQHRCPQPAEPEPHEDTVSG